MRMPLGTPDRERLEADFERGDRIWLGWTIWRLNPEGLESHHLEVLFGDIKDPDMKAQHIAKLKELLHIEQSVDGQQELLGIIDTEALKQDYEHAASIIFAFTMARVRKLTELTPKDEELYFGKIEDESERARHVAKLKEMMNWDA